MKIKTDFITNSSSSSFIVSRDSEYFNSLEPFTEKSGYDFSRRTGVYLGENLQDFGHESLRGGYPLDLGEQIIIAIARYGLDNVALIMISDEHMGGTLPYPQSEDILYEGEYH